MNSKFTLLAIGAGLLALTSCDDQNSSDDQYDLIERARQSSAELRCSTNEPFASIGFNYDGEGNIRFTYPNNEPPEFVGEDILTRIGGASEPGMTSFELSNGLTGYIKETPNGGCMDDMAGTLHNYQVTIENWGNDADANFVKTGCCRALAVSSSPAATSAGGS